MSFTAREVGEVVRVNGEPWEVLVFGPDEMRLKPRLDIFTADEERSRIRTQAGHKYLQTRSQEDAEAYLKLL